MPLKLETEGQKGYMEKMYTVWCGCCVEWDYVPDAQGARRRGWYLTREFGWICRKCVKKLDD